jgi:hypothetical protein
MDPQVDIPNDILKDLGELAVPFEDKSPADVIRKLIADYKKAKNGGHEEVQVFSTLAPPELSHTKVLTAKIKNIAMRNANWNALMDSVIKAAAEKFRPEKLDELVLARHVKGKKTDQGYRYFETGNISVQGQDATGAWKTTAHLLKELGYSAEVTFEWYDNPKASNPGKIGRFVIPAAAK